MLCENFPTKFETKFRAFAKSILGLIRKVTSLVIEEIFWNVASDKPIYIEYASYVPVSALEEPLCLFAFGMDIAIIFLSNWDYHWIDLYELEYVELPSHFFAFSYY